MVSIENITFKPFACFDFGHVPLFWISNCSIEIKKFYVAVIYVAKIETSTKFKDNVISGKLVLPFEGFNLKAKL